MEKIRSLISVVTIVCYLFVCDAANAQNKSIVSMETNLALLAMKGYSVNMFLKPAFTNKIKIGVGIYSLTSRAILMKVYSENNVQTIGLIKENIRIINAPSFHLEYYPNGVNKQWFIGEQMSFLNYQIFLSNEAMWSGKLRKSSWMTYGGYVYQFPTLPIYLKAWAGIGMFRLAGKHNFYNEKFEYNTMLTYMTGLNASFIF